MIDMVRQIFLCQDFLHTAIETFSLFLQIFINSLGSLFFTEQEVVDYTSAKSSDTKAFSEYFKGMLAQGIHMAPSQFEAMFLSVAHTDEIIDQTLEAVRNYFTK